MTKYLIATHSASQSAKRRIFAQLQKIDSEIIADSLTHTCPFILVYTTKDKSELETVEGLRSIHLYLTREDI